MSIGFILFCTVPNIAFRRAASGRLKVRFPDESAQVWRLTRRWQSRLAPTRPHHSAAVNLMMRYMEWSCGLYRAVQEHGMSQAEARALVEAVALDLYQPVPAAWFKLSRLRSAKRETRIKWILGMITRYFFAAPFIHRHLPSKTGVAFDVTLCPLANYFKDQGVPELTPHAACNLDYCAAREFGVELIRSQTIAEGAAHCDFRWKFPITSAD